MQTLPETAPTRNCVAFRAFLSNLPGVAMRTTDGRVHFRDDATETWRELFDADVPALQLNGRIDIYEAQWHADGDIYGWVAARNTHHARVAA